MARGPIATTEEKLKIIEMLKTMKVKQVALELKRSEAFIFRVKAAHKEQPAT